MLLPWKKVNDYDYDCVLLDIMLPGGSGLSILAHLKRTRKGKCHHHPAKDSIEDKVEGLDLGADDYLAKPFHLAELNARVKSLLRRKKAGGDTSIVLGNLTLVPDTRKATVDGNELNPQPQGVRPAVLFHQQSQPPHQSHGIGRIRMGRPH